MIHKIHAFVSSVIEMGKGEGNNETDKIIREYRDDLPIPGNAFREY